MRTIGFLLVLGLAGPTGAACLPHELTASFQDNVISVCAPQDSAAEITIQSTPPTVLPPVPLNAGVAQLVQAPMALCGVIDVATRVVSPTGWSEVAATRGTFRPCRPNVRGTVP